MEQKRYPDCVGLVAHNAHDATDFFRSADLDLSLSITEVHYIGDADSTIGSHVTGLLYTDVVATHPVWSRVRDKINHRIVRNRNVIELRILTDGLDRGEL